MRARPELYHAIGAIVAVDITTVVEVALWIYDRFDSAGRARNRFVGGERPEMAQARP